SQLPEWLAWANEKSYWLKRFCGHWVARLATS
ncbi:MAG: hypothetical protein ACI9WS_000223, partial [Paraglaciecola psychrophila]